MTDYPPTIIVVHPKERRSKCTVAPLRDRDDFHFWKYPHAGEESLTNYVRLGFDGPLLGPGDAEKGLLVLDGTWRFAAVMEQDYQHVPVRSLPLCKTAYPRVSKMFDDPAGGLATIEAIYVAYRQLGRECTCLLDRYRWKDEFLQLNDFPSRRESMSRG